MSAKYGDTIVLATRSSPLARWQTTAVREVLSKAWPELEFKIKTITTKGDRSIDQPLPEIGGKGLFTSELEDALLHREVDLAVHSLKDLPIDEAPGISVGAILARGDARDAFVTAGKWGFDDIPSGSVVGTSSLRRQSQILAERPDLIVLSIRGNVGTRVEKVLHGEYDAAVLAAAGLQRLGLDDHISYLMPFDRMLPAPGQGAIAVQYRKDDQRLKRILSAIDHGPTRTAVQAERTLLEGIGGGCSSPVGAYASWSEELLSLRAVVASLDGRSIIRVSATGEDPIALGRSLAAQALEKGASEIVSQHD